MSGVRGQGFTLRLYWGHIWAGRMFLKLPQNYFARHFALLLFGEAVVFFAAFYLALVIQLSEHEGKLGEADVKAIEAAKEELKAAAQTEDKARIEKAMAAFSAKAQKLGEIVYKETAKAQGKGAEEPKGASGGGDGKAKGDSDEPVDADFEVKA